MNRIVMLLVFITLILVSPLTSSTTPTATPIKHVIIIIEENHSFDNLFGTYPFGWPPIINNITLSVMWPEGLYTNYTQLEQSKDGVLDYITVPNVPWFPFAGASHPYYANAWDTVDPYEGWSSYHGDYWFGKPVGFVYYSGPQSMAYFSYQQVGILWDYAEEYVLADNYYAPVLGLTEPNRVAYLTGAPPNFYSDSASDVVPLNQTIFYQLTTYGVSWDYFVYNYQGGIPWPLNAFSGIRAYQSHIQGLDQFFSDLRDGNLPSVSWVMLIGCNADYYDMHPPYNVTEGAVELNTIINEVMKSPYWNSSVIFITFDEGGGYYDQVTPPAINSMGLGQRIPLLIISPYAKEAWVDNYTLSGYTLLGFIDYNWHLPWFTKWVEDSDVEGLLQAFNFSANPRPPIILTPNNWTYPIPLQYPVHYGYIAKVSQGKSYAQVYPAPAVSFLFPMTFAGFALIVASFFVKSKRKALLNISVILMLLVTGIALYYNSSFVMYSFVVHYYTYSGLIGFLVAGALRLKFDNKVRAGGYR
ncbi:alkaline phosphatase family protein [Stygiolobus caldivivus]|uniref:phospholipase C n=1 Tax=Stygiolobus caldivivus TaxID=2824673 RepID=UPI001C84E88E